MSTTAPAAPPVHSTGAGVEPMSIEDCLSLIEIAARSAREARAKAAFCFRQAELAPKVSLAAVTGDLRGGGPISASSQKPPAAALEERATALYKQSVAEINSIGAFVNALFESIHAEKAAQAAAERPAPRLVTE